MGDWLETDYLDRFWPRVERGSDDQCWDWLASTDKDGYGQIWIAGKRCRAHRVSFFLAHGHLPEPCCLHTCDNPRCVNPHHLFEGTHADNMQDAANKGRHRAHVAAAAARRAATHCKHGHEYTDQTTGTRTRNNSRQRVCRICDRERQREYIRRRMAMGSDRILTPVPCWQQKP